MRQAALRLDAEGVWALVADAVWEQVTVAVARTDDEVIAYTDVFDQPSDTKKFAHAAPIGRLGNRPLACAYFRLTSIKIAADPTLFARLSWHKPAAPLRDALEDDGRMAWWHEHVRLHIVDCGANGDGVLRWPWSREAPYLTIGRKSADLWRFRAPTLRTKHGLPITVRPDRRLDGDAEDGPWEVIVPADAEDPDARRGIPFRSAVRFDGAELLALNATYKSRWPSMENELKSLQALGFGRNRSRALELTTSRGVDGELARLREREASEVAEDLDAAHRTPPSRATMERMARAMAAEAHAQVRVVERAVRLQERLPDGAHGVVIGLDRARCRWPRSARRASRPRRRAARGASPTCARRPPRST